MVNNEDPTIERVRYGRFMLPHPKAGPGTRVEIRASCCRSGDDERPLQGPEKPSSTTTPLVGRETAVVVRLLGRVRQPGRLGVERHLHHALAEFVPELGQAVFDRFCGFLDGDDDRLLAVAAAQLGAAVLHRAWGQGNAEG